MHAIYKGICCALINQYQNVFTTTDSHAVAISDVHADDLKRYSRFATLSPAFTAFAIYQFTNSWDVLIVINN